MSTSIVRKESFAHNARRLNLRNVSVRFRRVPMGRNCPEKLHLAPFKLRAGLQW